MPTILCIDNDANFLELEKNTLETNGYTVVIASDGPTGITLASNGICDRGHGLPASSGKGALP